MKRIFVVVLSVLLFILCACSNDSGSKKQSMRKGYAVGTDFGGDIALVGYDHESPIPALTHSNICIDKTGKELFKLPNDWVAAQGYNGEGLWEVPPINNYIFATDMNEFLFPTEGLDVYDLENVDYSAKYVLDSDGNIILTPTQNNYDWLITSVMNFKGMVEDGFLMACYTQRSHTGTTHYLKFLTLDGEVIRDNVPAPVNMSGKWEYRGNGIAYIAGNVYDLKEYGFIPQNKDNGWIKVWGRNAYGNGVDFELDQAGFPELFQFNCGKAGVLYDNSGGRYIAIVDTKGEFVIEPFAYHEWVEGIYTFEDGFLVDNLGEIQFFDYHGNLLKTVDLLEAWGLPWGSLVKVKEYSCGYFRLSIEELLSPPYNCYDYELVNYMDTEGNLLFLNCEENN